MNKHSLKTRGKYSGAKIFFSVIFWCIGLTLSGQVKNAFSFSGIVEDSITKQPVPYASVALYKQSISAPITGVITNDKGEFVINNLNNGDYVVKVNFIGYKTRSLSFEIFNAPVKLASPVLLSSTSVNLAEVRVTGKLNEKQISIEKTKINVSQNISAVSGNVTDVLKSQPSISIDADNNLYLRGSGNILILMDGKPTTVTTLNSIPARDIESVEIITNPDAKYDAEGTGGIINIVMKKQSRPGTSGAVSLNYGVASRVNGGINLNINKANWNVGFNYNGKYEETSIHSNLARLLYGPSLLIEQEINSRQKAPNQVAALTISCKPSERNIIAFGVKVMFPDVYNSQHITGMQSEDFVPGALFNRRNEVTFTRKVLETTLSYRKIFEKNKNEISFDAFYSRTKGSRPAEYYIEDQFLQKSSGGGAPTNATIQADYFKTVSGSGRIESGLKAFSRWNNFNYYFYDFDTLSGQWKINPDFSNDLEHKEYIYSTYLMYSDSLSRKIFYKAGVRLEYSTSDLVQKSINDKVYYEKFYPFPFLLLKYTIDKFQNIGLSINRRVTRPTYPQLNPFIVVIDQYTYETGNKSLQPEIADKIELNHSWIKEKYQLRSNVYFSITKDFITQVSSLSNTNNLIVTYVNGGRQYKTGADLDINFKINKAISINPGFSVFYTKSTGNYHEIDLRLTNLAWTGNIKTSLKPDAKTDVQILLNYNSPVALPQFNLREIYYADLACKRSFMKNKLALSVSMTDVFNTRKWDIRSDNTIFRLSNTSKNDTRILWIGLTYTINSFKAGNGQKAEGNENDNGVIRLGQ